MEKIQDFGIYSRTPIKGRELSREKDNQQSINSTSNNDNLLQHFLAFQLAFNNFGILFLSSS